jgi:hypothetical protein
MIEFCGWLGMLLLLGAYLGVSLRLFENGLVFHAINLFGSIGIVVASLSKEAYQPAALNICWAAVALCGIYSGVHGKFSGSRTR